MKDFGVAYATTREHRRETHEAVFIERPEPTADECERLPFLAELAGYDPRRVASYEWEPSP